MPLIGQFRLLDTISLPLISPLDFSTLSLLFFKKNEREYRYDERNYGNYGERELKKVGLSIRARTFKVERRIDRGRGREFGWNEECGNWTSVRRDETSSVPVVARAPVETRDKL